MKTRFFILLTGFILLSHIAYSKQTAQVRLACGSLRFERGYSQAGASLDLTTIAPAVNGELQIVFFTNRLHRSDFRLSNFPETNEPVQGSLFLDVPFGGDNDANDFQDFYDVPMAVALTNTVGEFESSLGSGTISAAWVRNAGSVVGDCQLTFTFNLSGLVQTFNCQFSLIDYSGTLTYTPGSNTVSSCVVLSQSGHTTNILHGAMLFTKPLTNLSGQVTLQPGGWTNQNGQSVNYPETIMFRSFLRPNAYLDGFGMADGDPQTAVPDYPNWQITIVDHNDYDLDGISDLADDLYFLPRPPHLEWVRDGTNYFFRLSGDMWRQHDIQEAESIGSTNWQTVATFTLMNDPQLLHGPDFSAPSKFWRAVAR
jgi:hypothetical protein